MIIFHKFIQWIFSFIFKLPPIASIYLMRFAGEMTYRIALLTRLKKHVAGNLRLLFPEKPADELADRLLHNVAYSIFELLCVQFFTPSHFKRIVKIEGLEKLDLALAERKGAIFATMHTGNYELIPIYIASLGYRFAAIMKSPPGDPVFGLINRIRSSKGVKLINVAEDNMYQESMRELARNRVVGITIDTGALEGRHEIFPFLGRKLPVATGWLALAQRSQAPIIPVYSKREGKKLIITLGDPLVVQSNNREEVMVKLGHFFENFIRSHPEQWAMFLNDYETKRMVEGK